MRIKENSVFSNNRQQSIKRKGETSDEILEELSVPIVYLQRTHLVSGRKSASN